MRTALSVLLLCTAGCSLIVGNKLDEKATPDGAPRKEGLGPSPDGLKPDGAPQGDLPPLPTEVRGELGKTGKGPYLIGERIEIPVGKHPTSVALQVTIGPKADTSIPCVGARVGQVFACTVSPLTPDGAGFYFIKDEKAGTADAFAQLGTGPIEIVRLVGTGSGTSASVRLFHQATLKDQGSLNLPGPLKGPPRVSPSGRYLLAEHAAGGMVLVELGRGVVVKLPTECKLLEGSAFEPSFQMLRTSPKADAFFYFRPERGLYCSTGAIGETLVRYELPEPPAVLSAGALKPTKLEGLRGVVQATAFADLGGTGWLAGIVDQGGGKREVFVQRTGAGPSFISLAPLVPEQVVLSALEEAGGLSLRFAKHAYVVVRAKDNASGGRAAVLIDPLASKAVHQLDLPADLHVENLVWVTYTNLVALERSPGSNGNLAYLRLTLSQNLPVLALAQSAPKPPLPSGVLAAFPFTFVDSVLFYATYNRRFGQLAGNRIVVYADGSDKVVMDQSVLAATHGTVKLVVGHPVDERLLVLTDKRLVAFKLGNLLTADAFIPLAADGVVIQP